MKRVAEDIHGYTYGTDEVGASPVSMKELEELKTSAGLTAEDERYLRLAGEVLADQTAQIVNHWRSGIIASIPESRAALAHAGGRRDPRISGEEQPSFRAMDSGHVPEAV